jgi:hypothetical protein
MKTMPQGLRFNCSGGRSLLLVAAFAFLLPASAAATMPVAKSRGPLSPLLTELAKPAVAAKAPRAQDELLRVATAGPGGLIRDGERVQVTARFAHGAIAGLPQLREAGARIVSASREQQTATLAVAPDDLADVASVPGVRSVWQARRPISYGVGEGPCEGGSVISEGFGQLRVDEAREAFDLRGKGITIGVLSDSFDAATEADGGGAIATHAHQDVGSNDLPGPASACSDQQLPVDVLAEGDAEGADEGRAMLQILHDLAPHAQLAFATAFESEESFAQNIEALARPVSEGGAGADVIVDDVAWFEEPFFQDGPVAAAIDNVTAEGVTYLTAAGNDNLFEGNHEIASWEAPEFRDSGICPEAVALLPGFNGKHCMDFDPVAGVDPTFGITVEAGETLTVDLQWAEPWNGVLTDVDAFLLSGTGKLLTDSAEENSGPTGTQHPVEIVQWKNESSSEKNVELVINRFSGLNPRLKFILMENGGGVSATSYPLSSGGDVVGPSIFGHAGAASAISVAAVPFSNNAKVERYSSRGPVTHYFGPVNGLTPALPLGSPEEVAKPDLAGTDCGATTFFASLTGAGTWRFCGTSAAAPHAAAVAALVRQAKPSLSEQQVRDAMTETAAPVGAFAANAAGAGLVDAFDAIAGLPGPVAGGDGPSEVVPPLEGPQPNPPPPGPTAAVTPTPSPEPGSVVPPAPSTTIRRHPARVVRTHAARARVVFSFGSDERKVTFLCKVDRGTFHACPARLVLRLRPGGHVVRVKARGAGGAMDPTPAVFRFRVE